MMIIERKRTVVLSISSIAFKQIRFAGQLAVALELSNGSHTTDSDSEFVGWQQFLQIQSLCDLFEDLVSLFGNRLGR